jgi:hypothetical protein
MSERRFEGRAVRGFLKCSSVPDFGRNTHSLQLEGVKWTSPQHLTHSLYSLHLGLEENLRQIGQVHREKKLGSTRQNSDGAGATPPFFALRQDVSRPEHLIFATHSGRPLCRRNLLQRQLRPTCKELGLPTIT